MQTFKFDDTQLCQWSCQITPHILYDPIIFAQCCSFKYSTYGCPLVQRISQTETIGCFQYNKEYIQIF